MCNLYDHMFISLVVKFCCIFRCMFWGFLLPHLVWFDYPGLRNGWTSYWDMPEGLPNRYFIAEVGGNRAYLSHEVIISIYFLPQLYCCVHFYNLYLLTQYFVFHFQHTPSCFSDFPLFLYFLTQCVHCTGCSFRQSWEKLWLAILRRALFQH